MNTQQLLNLIDARYPNAVSKTAKIGYMNACMRELSAKNFGLLVESVTTLTVEDQQGYSFPTGLADISDIEYLAVASSATPASRYEYVQYRPGYANDNQQSGNKYFQLVSSAGVKTIGLYPVPTVAGYPIMIRFYRSMTELSDTDLTQEAEFDSRFHEILSLYACYEICASGASPDTIQANAFLSRYNDLMTQLKHQKLARGSKFPQGRKYSSWWDGRSI